MKLSRKEFLRGTLAAAGGVMGLAAVNTGCGGDDDGGGGGGGSGACSTSFDTNHGHTMSVSQADVDAAADKTYDIKGSAPHSHQVTLTAAQFASLKSGKNVSVESTDGGVAHTHNITIKCA